MCQYNKYRQNSTNIFSRSLPINPVRRIVPEKSSLVLFYGQKPMVLALHTNKRLHATLLWICRTLETTGSELCTIHISFLNYIRLLSKSSQEANFHFRYQQIRAKLFQEKSSSKSAQLRHSKTCILSRDQNRTSSMLYY